MCHRYVFHIHITCQAALKYTAKCVVMGEPWCLYNTMTERMTFLYVVIQKSEMFTQSWKKKKELVATGMGLDSTLVGEDTQTTIHKQYELSNRVGQAIICLQIENHTCQ